MLFHLILLIFIFQITGVSRALSIEGLLLVINAILISYFLITNFKKLEIKKQELKLYILVLFFYISFLGLGFIHSNYNDFLKVLAICIYNLLALLFVLLTYKKKKIIIIRYLWYGSLFLSITTIMIFFKNYDQLILQYSIPRAEGLIGNPNSLGITILILSLFIFLKKSINFVDYIIIFVNLTAIILTVSRSTILILLILLFILFLKIKLNIKYKIIIITISSASLIILYNLIIKVNPNYFNRFMIDEDFDNGRIDALFAGLENFYSSIFGVGIGNTNKLIGQSAHNFFIELLAQCGVFILPFIFLIIYQLGYFVFVSSKKSNLFLLSSPLLIFIYSFFSHRLHYMLPVILLFGVSVIESNTNNDNL